MRKVPLCSSLFALALSTSSMLIGCDPSLELDGGLDAPADASSGDVPTSADVGPNDAGDSPASFDGGAPDVPASFDGGAPDVPAPFDGGAPDVPTPFDGGAPDVPAPFDGGADAPVIDAPIAVCGDGRIEGAEVCDDGNAATETSCAYGTPTCTGCDGSCLAVLDLTGPVCGDGIVNGPEACESGAPDCTACELPAWLAVTDGLGAPHFGPAVSSDGRFVAWHSGGRHDPRDPSSSYDIYRRDLGTGALELVSVSADGLSASNGDSSLPSISGDGRQIVFTSLATNLSPDDVDVRADVYLWAAATGTVSLLSTGTEGTTTADLPRISGDGRWVVFQTDAPLLTGTTGRQVVRMELATRAIEIVSVGLDGMGAGGSEPSVTANGREVAFSTSASNLVVGDTNGAGDVFVRDVTLGTTVRVSVASDGTEANGRSRSPILSSSGRWVVFVSAASNLVPGDTNGIDDVFVHDRSTGQTVRASVTETGGEHTTAARLTTTGMSDTGVAVFTDTSALVAFDANNRSDGYGFDVVSGTVRLLSATEVGGASDNFSDATVITPDGRLVFFQSNASDVVEGTTPSGFHVYRRAL